MLLMLIIFFSFSFLKRMNFLIQQLVFVYN